jgi:D-amino-acid dehydrogenase
MRTAERAGPDVADVLVLGGGVVGVACARELARRGRRVVVLDRDRIGRGCSFGNAGWLTPSIAFPLAAPGLVRKAARWLLDPESPFYIQPRADPALLLWLVRFLLATRRSRFERGAAALVAMARWSVDAWQEIAARSPLPFGFERNGLLVIHETEAGLAAGRADAAMTARFGIASEAWSADELRDREPAVRGTPRGAIHYPGDAHCEPYAAVGALAEDARADGAMFVEGAEVTGVERSGGAVAAVHTSRGRFAARDVVLAAGAWSGALGRTLGLRLPMRGGKGYTLVLARLDPQPARSLYLAERKVAVNPHADALRLSGTLELVDGDLSVNRRRVDGIVRSARGLLDLPEPLEVRELWCGLRPCLPDGMPAIGRARGSRNLWLATGHQMTGLKAAPGTARLLAELMSGEPPSFDPGPFRADRYG